MLEDLTATPAVVMGRRMDVSAWNALAAALISGRIGADDVPPIRIFQKDGKIYSLDNRSLYTFREAGVAIRFKRATPEEVYRETVKGDKFSTKNDGVSIRVRGAH